MAFIMEYGVDVSPHTGVQPFTRIANVSFPVGPGKRNDPGDVQLVQLLIQFAIGNVKKVEILDSKGKPIKSLKVDGRFGPRTAEAIVGYQRRIVRGVTAGAFTRGDKPIALDGIVDRARQGVNRSQPAGEIPRVAFSTISKSIYTIIWLNAERVALVGEPLSGADVDVEPLASQLKNNIA